MSYRDRINLVAFPPCPLVTVAVERAVVTPAQRHGEFIADPAAEGPRLGVAQVVSVRRPPTADQARLGRHEPEVRAVAVAARFPACEGAFVDVPSDRVVDSGRRLELTGLGF
jgi:hypothetical protein